MSSLRTRNIIKFRNKETLIEEDNPLVDNGAGGSVGLEPQPSDTGGPVGGFDQLALPPGLTRLETAVLRFIVMYIEQNQQSPTITEIGKFLNHKSKGHTAAFIKSLKLKGYLQTRRITKWRGLRLTDKSVN